MCCRRHQSGLVTVRVRTGSARLAGGQGPTGSRVQGFRGPGAQGGHGEASWGVKTLLTPPTWPALLSVWQRRVAAVDIATAVTRARPCARARPIRIRGPTTRPRARCLYKKATISIFFSKRIFERILKTGRGRQFTHVLLRYRSVLLRQILATLNAIVSTYLECL